MTSFLIPVVASDLNDSEYINPIDMREMKQDELDQRIQSEIQNGD